MNAYLIAYLVVVLVLALVPLVGTRHHPTGCRGCRIIRLALPVLVLVYAALYVWIYSYVGFGL